MGPGCGGLGPILFVFALCGKQKPGEASPLLSLNLHRFCYYYNGTQILFSSLHGQASESRSKTGISRSPSSRFENEALSPR